MNAAQTGVFADTVALVLADHAARAAMSDQARLAAIERHEIERAVFDTESLYERVRAPHGPRMPGMPPRGRRTAA